MSLLHIAAESCNFEIVEYLLSKGLDINQISENGTPLELAIMWNKLDMAQFLISKNADPNGSKGKYFPPCVVMASSMNNLSAINLLIHAGADVNLCGADGVTALEVACEFNFSFIDLLISKGAKVTGRVITAAFKNKKYEVVEKFLSLFPVEKSEQPKEKNNQAEEFKNQGNVSFHHKDYESAVNYYTKAIESSPVSIYYSNRSQAYILLGKYDEAIQDARKGRSLDSLNVKALLREGQALSLLNQNIEAAGCYYYATKLDSNPSISKVFIDTLKLII